MVYAHPISYSPSTNTSRQSPLTKRAPLSRCPSSEPISPRSRLAAASHEAGLAEHWLAAFLDWARLERHLAGCATLGTRCIVHFAGSAALVLASVATVLAALGSAQVLGIIELLFTVGEREVCAAIAANDLLIGHKEKRKKR